MFFNRVRRSVVANPGAQFLNTTDPASAPDIITIMLGTNDAKYCNWHGPANGEPRGAGTRFAQDYVHMLQLFKALPSRLRVYVVLPPPAISQCAATGPRGNASVCLAYNMSFRAIFWRDLPCATAPDRQGRRLGPTA